jgi:hypothetical protein
VKNKSNRIPARGQSARALLLVSMASLVLGGCATSQARPRSTGQNTDAYVDSRMSQTVDSVDRSLKVLVSLNRGDEGPRKSGFLGDTVAGASGPNLAAPAMPGRAQPQTALGQKEDQARLNYNRLALQTRVNAVWNGTASDLLRQLSQRIDYRFAEVGPGLLPDVHVNKPDSTVQDVLGEVASQLRPAGAIKVLVGPREICLVHGSLDTACPPIAAIR